MENISLKGLIRDLVPVTLTVVDAHREDELHVAIIAKDASDECYNDSVTLLDPSVEPQVDEKWTFSAGQEFPIASKTVEVTVESTPEEPVAPAEAPAEEATVA